MATGATFVATESTGIRTGGTFARIGVIFVRTGGSSIRPFRGETTRKPIKFAETCGTTREMCGLTGGTWFVIVATSGMIAATSGTTAEIFERVSGKEFDRSYFEEPNNGGGNLPPTLRLISYDESLCDPLVLCS